MSVKDPSQSSHTVPRVSVKQISAKPLILCAKTYVIQTFANDIIDMHNFQNVQPNVYNSTSKIKQTSKQTGKRMDKRLEETFFLITHKAFLI